MTTTQKAVLVTEIGKPVQLGTRDVPSPKQGQVLVKVTATMILPHDTYGRDWGTLINAKLPAVLGSNLAGVIEKVGAGVHFKVGDKIFGISSLDPNTSEQAGLQEYAVLNANAIGKIPEGFSYEQVVTLPINLVTSWATLFTKTGFNIRPSFTQEKGFDYDGTTILIIGGGTNVGQFAVQLARVAGIGKIIVIAGASNNDKLRAMGATHVIDRHGSVADISHQIQAIVGPDSVTQVYSCAQLQVDLATAVLSKSKPSMWRSLLPIEPEEVEKLKSQRPLCDVKFVDDLTNESMGQHAERFWEEVPQWLKDGKVLPTEYRVVRGLESVKEIDEALDAYRDFTRVGAQTVVKIAE